MPTFDDAVARASAATDVAYARYWSHQEGPAQLIARLRHAAEQLSEDVYPGSGRFDAALHGLIETSPGDRQYGVKEALRSKDGGRNG